MSNSLSGNIFAFYLVYLMLGFIHIFIAFNIMHDATHNAYSSNKTVNNILGYSMDFIGGNRYLLNRCMKLIMAMSTFMGLMLH